MTSPLPRLDLRVFVATRDQDVPREARPFVSVDGSVPGATWTWDHHVSGEAINLDAMPAAVDLDPIRGVATTMADCDALASVVAVLFGGEARVPAASRRVLRAASWACDHLAPDPSAGPEDNRRGAALNRFVSASLADASAASRSSAFAALCRGVALSVALGEELPEADAPDGPAAAKVLADLGRLSVRGDVVLVDWRGLPRRWRAPPDFAFEAAPAARVGLWIDEHPSGGPRYTVGSAPGRGPRDLSGLLLRLARMEHAHGPPCRLPVPGPGSENWGGRATVFGSPWNYGSRLAPAEVEAACAEEIGPGSAASRGRGG